MADKARVDRPGEGLVKLEAGTQGVEGAGVLFSADCREHREPKTYSGTKTTVIARTWDQVRNRILRCAGAALQDVILEAETQEVECVEVFWGSE